MWGPGGCLSAYAAIVSGPSLVRVVVVLGLSQPLPQRSDRCLGALLGGRKPALRGAEIGFVGDLVIDCRQLVPDFG